MKGLLEREFVAQLVIILGISLGGWILIVHPKVKKIDQMQSMFDSVSPGDDELTDYEIEALARTLSEGGTRIRNITYLNKLAENSTLLYSMVSDLGAKCDVAVRSLTPGSRTTHQAEAGYSATRMDMVLEGRYENVAGFVNLVQNLPGFIRPISLMIKPAGEEPDSVAVANFSCEVVQFALPEELMKIGVGQ